MEDVKLSSNDIKIYTKDIKESQTKVCQKKALKKGIRTTIGLCVVVVVVEGMFEMRVGDNQIYIR